MVGHRRKGSGDGDEPADLGAPQVLGSFEHTGTGMVHVAMTGGRTLCGLATGELGLRGNDVWSLRDETTPVTCHRCLDLALKGGRL